MYGDGIIKGLGVTLKHFFGTFADDFRWLGRRYYTRRGIQMRTSTKARGIFTIQYPEEKMPVPEEFRYVPFLIYDEGENGERIDRCTSCGICSKVCPPQCIWIVRTHDPATGRPIPSPAEFYVDVDICMNCGLCAEFCPFDAIKMDHDYELSVYNRKESNIYNKAKLEKPLSYYAKIRPANYSREMADRAAAEAAKAAKKSAASKSQTLN
jgi:NADH-quinone oxidoreductase subunit I